MNTSNSPSRRNAIADPARKGKPILKPSEEIAIGMSIASARDLIITKGLSGIIHDARNFTNVSDYLKYVLLQGLSDKDDLELIFSDIDVITKIQAESEWEQELVNLEKDFPSEEIIFLILSSIRKAIRNI